MQMNDIFLHDELFLEIVAVAALCWFIRIDNVPNCGFAHANQHSYELMYILHISELLRLLANNIIRAN